MGIRDQTQTTNKSKNNRVPATKREGKTEQKSPTEHELNVSKSNYSPESSEKKTKLESQNRKYSII